MTKEEHDRIYGKDEPKDRLDAFLGELGGRVTDPCPYVSFRGPGGEPGIEIGVKGTF